MRLTTLVAVCAMVATGANAQNSLAGGLSLDAVLALVEEQGLSGEITDSANHTANVSIGENTFGVDGYNCSGGGCTEFLFSIGYDLENGFPLEKINEWNSTRLGGRAWLDDENDPWVDHVISLSGPDDRGAFEEGFLLWMDVIYTFEEFLAENISPGV